MYATTQSTKETPGTIGSEKSVICSWNVVFASTSVYAAWNTTETFEHTKRKE
jgi:hypothetical protein